MKTLKLIRAMTHQPSNDSPCVLFVLNVEVEEGRRNSPSTWRKKMRGTQQHGLIAADVDM